MYQQNLNLSQLVFIRIMDSYVLCNRDIYKKSTRKNYFNIIYDKRHKLTVETFGVLLEVPLLNIIIMIIHFNSQIPLFSA